MYTFFNDPGHGWLQVSKEEVKKLGIKSKISRYSYMDDTHVYLEEDCDAVVFIHAKGYTSPEGYQVFHSQVQERYQENIFIRNLPHYDPRAIV